jgi:hypothetical protein
LPDDSQMLIEVGALRTQPLRVVKPAQYRLFQEPA